MSSKPTFTFLAIDAGETRDVVVDWSTILPQRLSDLAQENKADFRRDLSVDTDSWESWNVVVEQARWDDVSVASYSDSGAIVYAPARCVSAFHVSWCALF